MSEPGVPSPPPRRGGFVTGLREPAKKAAAAGLVRFAGWWSLFAGALALNSVCPVCGNAGCPTGIGSLGLIAAVMAFFKQYGGGFLRRLRAAVRAEEGSVPKEPVEADHGAGRRGHMDHTPDERCTNERK
ncbi:MAG: hypothetical protein KBA15_09150 [Spirochaetes bacterium]|nr:hypothetical protein [Spirochaetota bacterium]